MTKTHKYYDGIPEWMKNLSNEELDRLLEKEKKRLAETSKNQPN